MLSYSIANISFSRWFKFFHIGNNLKIAFIPIIGFFLYCMGNDIKFQYRWGISAQMANYGITYNILARYADLWNNWNGDPLFLYNYAAILNRVGQYEASNIILIKCSRSLVDYDTEMTMADNYERSGEYQKAIDCFNTARHMCPNRFVPLYRLMIIYHNYGRQEEAKSIAKTIITKPIKIQSNTVSQIRMIAQNYLNNTMIIY